MKYQYYQGKDRAWISEYSCTNYFCDLDCSCGLTFEEAKAFVVEYYEQRLEEADKLTEEGYYK